MELPTVEDRQQLRAAHAAAHGDRLTSDGQSLATKSFTRQLHRRAFPTLYRRRRAAPEA